MKHFLLFSALFILFSCSKEESSKWLVVDLTVKNASNEAPKVARIEIQYAMKVAWGYNVSKRDIGWTDESGKLYIEQQFPLKATNFAIYVYANQQHYSLNKPDYIQKDLSRRKKNVVEIKM